MSLEKDIRKYALLNAVKFNGKANPGNIVGHLIRDDPAIKEKMKETMLLIKKVVDDINSMTIEMQEKEIKKLGINESKKEKKEGLKELPNVKGKVVMRFEPSPSGPLHIGHSYVLSLNYEYVKKYKGKLILRIADTNPENIDPDAYNQIPIDANWLCEEMIMEVLIQSDNMEAYYSRASELIEKDAAYICTCDAEDFRNLLNKSTACPCRKLSKEENLERYERMFKDTRQGGAVMRFRSDIKHKNPAMRDFPLMRINVSPHPRKGDKYRVWPLMNLAVAVDDMESRVTHTLRAKDHADNALRQAMIHEVFGFRTPEAISVGRINFEGFELSTTKTKEKIAKGAYHGWDDPRLPFIPALKRRGYKPEALRKFAVSMGVTKTDKTVHLDEFFKTINAFNKETVEKEANRYFFVSNPVKIKVEGSKSSTIRMPLHPDDRKRGYRSLQSGEEFYIARHDFDKLPDSKMFRLIDCINITKRGKRFLYDSSEYEVYKEKGCCRLIHWLPVQEEHIDVEVLMDDGRTITGYGEKSLKSVKKHEVIQFERFGFATLDRIEKNKLTFVYLHR